MSRIKKILLLVLLTACAQLCFGQAAQNKRPGQARPDFSGTWALTKYEDNSGTKIPDLEVSLVVSHLDPELRVQRKSVVRGTEYKREALYYTDGRGETNVISFNAPTLIKSKTKWNKNRLVIKASREVQVEITSPLSNLSRPKPDSVGTEETVEEWELSADGKTLTQVIKISVRLDKFQPFTLSLVKTKSIYTRVS